MALAHRTDPAAHGRATTYVAAVGVALALALLPAVQVRAATPTLSTPFPAVTVGPGSTVNFEVTVHGDANAQVSLAVSGAPEGWTSTLRGGGYVVNGVQLDGSGEQSLTLEVDVPATAADGLTTITLTASGSGGQSSLSLRLQVSAGAAGDVTLTSDFPSLRGPSGTTFTFNLVLRNDTSEDLTYAVTAVGPEDWVVNATLTGQSQAASAIVKAGSTAGVSVSADAPDGAATGSYPINVRATVGDRTIDGSLSVEITGTNDMTLTTPDQRLSNSGAAGGSISQELVIRNDGTQPLEQVTVSASTPSDWTVTYDPAETVDSVAPGESATVTATIVPSNDAIAGDYVVTFTARAGTTTSAIDMRITVETSPFWGFVGLAVIAGVLAGLWWVFQRYGRR